jgi:ABC-type Fe3+-hydroxamate transport system substrate-binding protein
MKKIFVIFLGAIAFAACNSKSSTASESTTDSTGTASTTEKVDYPYTIDHPDNWNIGSSANTLTALTALKAFEDGDVEKSVSQFGDSVHLQFDALDTTLSNDGLKAMFTNLRNGYKSMNVKMNDWESVVSKDGKEEWVTMWYKQIWEDNKGKKDSADYINDIRLKNGKIIRLDEYTRKLHN